VRQTLKSCGHKYLEDHRAGQGSRGQAESVDSRARVRLSLSRARAVPSKRTDGTAVLLLLLLMMMDRDRDAMMLRKQTDRGRNAACTEGSVV